MQLAQGIEMHLGRLRMASSPLWQVLTCQVWARHPSLEEEGGRTVNKRTKMSSREVWSRVGLGRRCWKGEVGAIWTKAVVPDYNGEQVATDDGARKRRQMASVKKSSKADVPLSKTLWCWFREDVISTQQLEWTVAATQWEKNNNFKYIWVFFCSFLFFVWLMLGEILWIVQWRQNMPQPLLLLFTGTYSLFWVLILCKFVRFLLFSFESVGCAYFLLCAL